ncbi:MAG: primosomal protein N' [Butyrivibrio sp.]|uniref:replication restart helicase PriA n=1 Tax=Butyrivibrio sp. TaxID=28121 RepID=UPI0025CDBC35|nr:primosomal protein N' [Butyrivibrio sp.]MCR5771841.1 primosomal protein N' [Butyrivibrio sp.]
MENTTQANILYAKIIIDISHEQVDRTFCYKVPDKLIGKIDIGSSILVPFGRGNHTRCGYVMELTDTADFDPSKIKEIIGIATDNLPAEDIFIKLAVWMKRRYGSTMYAALKTVLPAHKKQTTLKHRFISLRMPQREANEYLYECRAKNRKAQERLLAELLADPEERIPYELVTGKLNISAATIRSLKEKCVIDVTEEEYYRDPVKINAKETSKLNLSSEQKYIVDKVINDFDNNVKKTYLIHGITGSGKTEVYIRMIEQIIERGKQAIVLIPEISLTYQTLMRFYRHFGNRVSVMNSTLSAGEKYDQFERARNGQLDIIIGPRSALFTPFPNLGLIIIDEEHEPAYKSEQMPKYHARETAIELSKLVDGGASVVLGSATPSLEAYYRATTGEYELFELTKRLTGGTLPEVECVDLRDELRSGNRSIFSRSLKEGIEDRLKKHEQIMLFINRRGLAGFVSCRSCGHVFKCPHCDVSLSEHRGGRLVCHYCGYSEPITRICPECGSKYVSAFRAGTEQIEKEVLKNWPQTRVLRMDADTTRTKDSYQKILSAFSNEEADILIGTQMIVKGHDFPKVTLVGVLAADMSLYANDYRASERTFQLLTQAAGRAGRGELLGKVIVQSYQPDHYAIQTAAKQDYNAFFDEEISYRRLLAYPPVAHMMAVQITSKNEEAGISFSNRLRVILEQPLVPGIDTVTGTFTQDSQKDYNINDTKIASSYVKGSLMESDKPVIIGPAAANISKINDVFRFVIYVKSADYAILTGMKDRIERYTARLIEAGQYRGYSVQFDFDPINGF